MSQDNHKTEINIEDYLKEHENKQLLRFITCGSVDDGKSTLIGRLLYDSKMIFEDQLASIQKDSKKYNASDNEFDLSLLVDGLQSEREQGITIDVAYRYFSTNKRKFIIADTPGHEQYTRNMATGASTADLAIILIDARHGIQTQTKRHSFITKLLGIKHIIVTINKMDLVDFNQEIFDKLSNDYLKFAKKLGMTKDITIIPVSALNGDNVVKLSQNSTWYTGQSLIECLENINIEEDRDLVNFRFPVQYINRPNLNFRGFCGTIASGNIQVGDKITVLPSNKTSSIKEIILYNEKLPRAFAQQAITLTLNDEIDISRGNIIVKSDNIPKQANTFDVDIVWMSEDALLTKKQYYIKRATSKTIGIIDSFYYKTDVNTLEKHQVNIVNLNEITRAKLKLEENIAFDEYDSNKIMGSFIMIDKISNNTVGAGMIRNKSKEQLQDVTKYSDFEVEFNALIRKHFPHWNCKEII